MSDRSDSVARIATSLRVDAIAREVIDAFEQAGIPSVLLRGPSTAQFYPDGIRAYGDVDLLVEPTRWSQATSTLRSLGFGRNRPADPLAHAESFNRGPLETIDLHRTVLGVNCSAEQLFSLLVERAGRRRATVADLPLLDPPAALFVCTLHAAHHGVAEPKPLEDLSLALQHTTWDEVTESHRLAVSLDALEAFNAGLRVIPLGSATADRLGLDPQAALAERLRAQSAPPASWTIVRLRESEQPWREVRRTLFPHPSTFASRAWVRRLPDRGPGLAITYPVWFARLAYEMARSVVWVVRNARRL